MGGGRAAPRARRACPARTCVPSAGCRGGTPWRTRRSCRAACQRTRNEPRRHAEVSLMASAPGPSRALQPIAPLDGFELDANGILDRDDGSRRELEGGERRAELVDGERGGAVHE